MPPECLFVPLYAASAPSTRGDAARCYPYAPSPYGYSSPYAPPSVAYELPAQGSVDPLDDSSAEDVSLQISAILGLEAESILGRFLGEIYKLAPKPPAGEANLSTSTSVSVFFQKSLPQSGISIPPGFTEELDSVTTCFKPEGSHKLTNELIYYSGYLPFLSRVWIIHRRTSIHITQ